MTLFFSMLVPGILAAVAITGTVKKVDVYQGLADGAMEGMKILLRILPALVGLLLIRPVSGSGALGVGSELIQRYGPDSLIGRTAAVMLGSTETTFYTIAVYFGAAGIRDTRYAIPAALCADLCGFVAASWAVRLFFGG